MEKAFNLFLILTAIGAVVVAVTSLNQLNQAVAMERVRLLK